MRTFISLRSHFVSRSEFLPLLGRGGHPFFLDKKGRKSQGKTNRSARFSEPRAHHGSKKILVKLKIIADESE
jgi:hypothetical protein